MVHTTSCGSHDQKSDSDREFVHAGQKKLGENLNSFWAEFEAYSAQKRIVMSLDSHGIKSQLDESVSWLRSADDMSIANYVKEHYGFPIPPEFTPGGRPDAQIARAAIAAAKKVWAVGTRSR